MAPVDTVYQIWRNFEGFPDFMDNIEEVRDLGNGRSHWKAKAPLGQTAEWDAQIVRDEAAREIAWRSIETRDTSVTTEGAVRFEPEGDATRFHVTLGYEPLGSAQNIIAKIFADPEGQVEGDLARFKDGVERGGQFQQSARVVREGEIPGAPPQSRQAAERDSQVQGHHPPTDHIEKMPGGRGMSDEPQEGRPTTTGTPGGTLGAPTERELKANPADPSEKGDMRDRGVMP
jgi:hypothetical protein